MEAAHQRYVQPVHGHRPQRPRRWARRVGLLLFVVALPWVAYVTLGNLFLNLGGIRWILGSTREITIAYRFAWTVWPGRVNLQGFHLTFQDVNVQFALDLEHANVRFELMELPSRTFHATRLRGSGASFRMRHRIQPEVAGLPWVRALAPIPEFSDPPLFESTVPTPPIPESDYRLWTVHLEDVDVGVSEMWVQFIRYRGDARATGAFRLRPARQLWVGPAALALTNGDVTLGGDSILGRVHGRITCTAHPFDVRVPVGLAVLRHISSHIELHGDGLQLDALPRWFSRRPEIGLATAPGKLDVSLEVFHGRAEPGSSVSVGSEWLELGLPHGSLAAQGVRAESRVLPDGGADSALRVKSGQWRLKSSTLAPLEFADLALGANIARADSADPPKRADRRASVGRVRIPDARWLNQAFALRDVKFAGGSIIGRAALEEHDQRVSGSVNVELTRVALLAGGLRTTSDGQLAATLHEVSGRSGRAQVDARLIRTRLESADAPHFSATQANIDDLALNATLQRKPPGTLSVNLQAKASDARAMAGTWRVRARPELELSAAGEPLDDNLHAELTLHELNASTTSKDADCPWLKSPLTRLKLALSEQGMELAARIAQLEFGWGDFRASTDAEIESWVRGQGDETTPPLLAFAVKNRALHLSSGHGDAEGWEMHLPHLDTSGEIALSAKHPGHIAFDIEKLGGRIGRTQIASRLRAQAQLAELDFDHSHARFSANVRLGPAEVHAGTEQVRDWWAQIELGSGLITAGNNLDLSAMFRANLRDATPALAVLAEHDAVPDLIARNLTLERLQVVGIVQRRCRLTDFLITQASGGPLSARGRLHSTTGATRAALLLRINGLEAISAGVALGPNSTSIVPLAGDDWLREQREAIDVAASRVLTSPCAPTTGVCGEGS